MFTELMPLIKHRPLTITVAAVGDTQIRVNVVPKPLDKDKAGNEQIKTNHQKEVAAIPASAINALATPLSLTGTPEEIDAGLAKTLSEYTASHVALQNSCDNATKAIKEAVTAIDERERVKKEKDKAEKKGTGSKITEEKKKVEDPGLPPLFMAPASNPVAVSANDAKAGEASAQTGPGLSGTTQATSEPDDAGSDEDDDEDHENRGDAEEGGQ